MFLPPVWKEGIYIGLGVIMIRGGDLAKESLTDWGRGEDFTTGVNVSKCDNVYPLW